ncbi:uncharacterized protein LOC103829502 [Brassica rapa]|uniref:uncharacterized protein LOC103829502 n=1 Tax=Brassica campestris TaxID=3711 RepID=UPI0004F179F8|nr:uncharacterized protein LOC103829502 [Brassica rapa]
MVVDLQVVLGYDRVYTVEPVGLSGGLALMWSHKVNLCIKYADKNLIDAEVSLGGVNFSMSFVYGEPGYRGKEIVWERLMRYGVNRKGCWGWVGDFSEILHNGEKIGGPSRSEGSFESFRDCVRVCEMVELSGFGDGFTWSGVRNKKYIQSKLDRCFGNKEWRCNFSLAVHVFMERLGSDHKPVLVRLFGHQPGPRGCFRFDKRMVGKQKVRECIVEAWNNQNGNNPGSLVERFGNVRRSLGRWKRENGINSKERLCVLRSDLEAEYSSGSPDWEKIKYLKSEVAKAFRDEEEYWRQKSKDKWLVAGDNNTSFFHASVKDSRQKNQLLKLVNETGQEATNVNAMGQVAVEYFTSLFSTGDGGDLSDMLDGFTARVTAEMNERLTREVTDVEIREAVFGIKASSAPGKDGLNGLFFQKYWDIIGPDITKEIRTFFTTGTFPQEWNVTQLCLIPKVISP